MKKKLPLLLFSIFLFFQQATAQTPQGFKYQSIARNASGVPIASSALGIRIIIHDQTATGTTVYRETHAVTTNAFGLFTITVGQGTPASGTFASVAWGTGSKFLEVEADFAGGTNYISMGASQLLSVPYALYAASGTPGPQGLTGPAGTAGPTGAQGPQGLPGNAGATGATGPAGAQGTAGISLNWLGTLATNPASPTLNQAYYNSTDKKSYVYSGSVWNILSQDGGVGAQGPTGAVGATGITGATGAQGAQGPQGVQGNIGATGATGAAGAQGAAGISLSWLGTLATNPASSTVNQAYYNSTDKKSYVYSGSVWNILSQDGAVGALGPAGATGAQGAQGPQGVQGNTGATGATGGVGAQGVAGISLSWLGTLATNPASPTLSQAYYNSTDKKSYVYSGSVWNILSQDGAVGAQGPAGATGAQGAQGLQGVQGNIGVTGATGAQGVQGTAGISLSWLGTLATNPASPTVNQAYYNSTDKKSYVYSGSVWNILSQDGAVGAQGPAGATGAQGAQGPQGVQGNIGVTGATGAQGAQGPQGVQGNTGATGATGMLTPGVAAGNTPYWNGTTWVVNNSNIFNNGANVGIGTSTAGAKLDVAGNVKITDGTQGVGKVLTSDANGLATWATSGLSFPYFGFSSHPSFSFSITNDNTGRAGEFKISNSGSTAQALYAETNGSGYSLWSRNMGTGSAAVFDVINPANSNTALASSTSGLGNAGSFNIGNTLNYSNAVNGSTVGGGSAIYGMVASAGSGIGVKGYNLGTGVAGEFIIDNINNSQPVVNILQGGTGIGININSNNASNSSPSVMINQTGSGNAITAIGKIQATQFIGDGSLLTNVSGVPGPQGPQGLTGAAGPAGATGAGGISLNWLGTFSTSLASPTLNQAYYNSTVKKSYVFTGAGWSILSQDGADGQTGPAGPAGQDGAANAWGKSGTSGTADGTNFIGTTDNVALNFRVNNVKAGRIGNATDGSLFLGYQAGNVNTDPVGTGTGVGYRALANNTNGMYNTASGYSALQSNTTGSSNTAHGASSLNNNTTGNGNTANGSSALSFNTTGSGNTANGSPALSSNTTGSGNTANGRIALNNNTIGDNNTAVGALAGSTNATGSQNTYLGYNAGPPAASSQLSNSTALGANAILKYSNQMGFGDPNITVWSFGFPYANFPETPAFAFIVGSNSTNGNGAMLSKGGVWTNASDRNKKENFTELDGQDILARIKQLPVTRWNYKGEAATNTHIGPMAQDFYKLFQTGNDNTYISTIDPAGISLVAIQELIRKIEALEKIVTSQQESIGLLKAENEQLKDDTQNRLEKRETMLGAKAQK